MKCKDAQRYLSDSVDNALAPTKARVLEDHLGRCAHCQAHRRQLLMLKQVLSLKRHESPQPLYLRGMSEEFHRRLQAQDSAGSAVRWANLRFEAMRRWRERTARIFARNPLLSIRYGLAAAVAAALVLNAAILVLRSHDREKEIQQVAGTTEPRPAGSESKGPTYVLDSLPAEGASGSVWF